MPVVLIRQPLDRNAKCSGNFTRIVLNLQWPVYQTNHRNQVEIGHRVKGMECSQNFNLPGIQTNFLTGFS
jgi:hypothetical protein